MHPCNIFHILSIGRARQYVEENDLDIPFLMEIQVAEE
jgi:hypothetical protein